MKKILVLAVVAAICFTCCFAVTAFAEETSSAKVTFNDIAARKGDVITITVTLSDCSKIKSMAVVPLYDPSRMEYINGNWLIGGGVFTDWDQEEQNGVIMYSSETDVNGAIAEFVFKLKDNESWQDIDFSCKVVLKNGNAQLDVTVDTLAIYLICDHIWNETVHTNEPTCMQEGYTYNLCEICDREKKLTFIEKSGHAPSEWIVDVAPTIFKEGHRHKECLVCGEIMEERAIPVLETCKHILEDEVYIKESTCSDVGMTYKICQLCGERIKISEIASIAHTNGDWIVDKESTLFKSGERHKECNVCGQVTDTELIPKAIGIIDVVIISVSSGVVCGLIVFACFMIAFSKLKRREKHSDMK